MARQRNEYLAVLQPEEAVLLDRLRGSHDTGAESRDPGGGDLLHRLWKHVWPQSALLAGLSDQLLVLVLLERGGVFRSEQPLGRHHDHHRHGADHDHPVRGPLRIRSGGDDHDHSGAESLRWHDAVFLGPQSDELELHHQRVALLYDRPGELVQNALRCARRHPDAKYIIVGEGWSRDILEAEVKATGHANKIRFTGFASDTEVINLMTSADALIVPSIYEPFGIVALEGMATGVPVVASKVGGLAEVIEHEKTGLFVYPRNIESIAWGIDKILSDPNHARWLTENAKEKLHKAYSWEAVAMKTVEVYRKVVE